MVVHWLMWPLWQARLRDSTLPRWFHARVMAQLRDESSATPSRVMLGSALAWITLSLLVLVRTWYVGTRMILLLLLCMGWGALWLVLEIHEARMILVSGKTHYDRLACDMRASLPEHERSSLDGRVYLMALDR